MRALDRAERSVTLMEGQPGTAPVREIEGLERTILGAGWMTPDDRQAAQTILMRLALLKHAARSAAGQGGGDAH